MPLRDPVAVYNAASNAEAHLVRNMLLGAGVEAFVTEDVSQVGTWMFGLIPELHKPQVWIERTDLERVKPILEDFDRRAAQRRTAATERTEPPIEILCEECGRRTTFPSLQRGSVQECPHCGAYLDVEDEEAAENGFD